MKSKLEKEIRKEINQYKEKHGEHWGMEYFDNFDSHLPGGYTREPGSNLNFKAWEGDNDASLKLREQSLGEFLKTVDKVIEEIGLKPANIIDGRNDGVKDDILGVLEFSQI